ncbi:MAG: hypothetical protein M1522_00315 [Actinobacteria bacterium]|jgi:hypothetical protein|nr:hypothetical protein [Actinomycetota bacterium]
MGSRPQITTLDVGVDLDGCVYPFVEVLRDWIHLDTDRPLSELPYPTSWHFFEEQWGYERDEFPVHVARGVSAGVIFRSGLPIQGSVSTLQQIADAGHRIHVVTARFAPGAEDVVAASTHWWLKTHGVPYLSLTISADKNAVPTDVFIDDSPANYAEIEAAGGNPWLYDRPWNADAPGRRVRSWTQFGAVVQRLGSDSSLSRQGGEA